MDDNNFPYAVLEIVQGGNSLGTWLVSPWLNSQDFTVAGKPWRVAFRSERAYQPFSVKLLKTTHEVYRGTEIPKNFQSRVHIENPAKGETRDADIYMNNPLRYAGLTFFQYQMGQDQQAANVGTSTLQVVSNPSWLTPYLGCILVALGMIYQFLFHLVGFITKRRAV
jgi:cytochrome c biogenesis protein ResB